MAQDSNRYNRLRLAVVFFALVVIGSFFALGGRLTGQAMGRSESGGCAGDMVYDEQVGGMVEREHQDIGVASSERRGDDLSFSSQALQVYREYETPATEALRHAQCRTLFVNYKVAYVQTFFGDNPPTTQDALGELVEIAVQLGCGGLGGWPDPPSKAVSPL